MRLNELTNATNLRKDDLFSTGQERVVEYTMALIDIVLQRSSLEVTILQQYFWPYEARHCFSD